MLSAKGKFSNGGAFHSFLDRVGATGDSTQGAFSARNFLLDEGVSESRVRSYSDFVDGGALQKIAHWAKAHKQYFEHRVGIANLLAGDPPRHWPDDPDLTPETFMLSVNDARRPVVLVRADSKIGLLRIVEAEVVASIVGVSPDLVVALADRAIGKTGDYQDFDDLMAEFCRKGDLRPVFAAFWPDVSDYFGNSPQEDNPLWADELTSRFGMVKPDWMIGTKIPVLAFKYFVGSVATADGTNGRRTLIAPTVLDGSLCEAFCPSPGSNDYGHTVDLSGAQSSDVARRREVVHPPFRFTHRQLWRTGTATVRAVDLKEARASHLKAVRDSLGFSDYGSGTDGDLL